MDLLKDIIQRCHQRHESPLRQRKTVITPALYKGLPYQFTVYCAHRYRVRLYDLEQADVSFMPIGRAPTYDSGPRDFGGERFLKRQSIEDWIMRQWHASWGIQVYTGIPSEQDGARWHDLDFTYQAICAAPDAVFACIETLVNAVANPLLTLTKSGGLRFSCRAPEYLHANTEAAKQYIYKHTATVENSHQRDVYLEISGAKGYNRWDGRYEIVLGNLLDPPVISKEVLFAPINTLRSEIHELAPLGQNRLNPTSEAAIVVPPSSDSYNLNLATEAFLTRGFSYVRQENDFHHWVPPGSKEGDAHVLLWKRDGTVWVRASTPNAGLPMEATPITDIWDDTGILPPIPAAGVPVSDEVLAVREGKLSPLAIKRSSKTLQKSEDSQKVYGTLEENAIQIQRAFEGNASILGLIAEKGAGKSYGVENYALNGGSISLNAIFSVAEETEQSFQKRNVPSVVRRRPRRYLWEQVKAIPVDLRMATPFQRGNVCEDPERCDALEKKGGDPRESICPKCPVYMECQERGYLSQPIALQRAQAQISGQPQLFFNPRYGEMVEEMLGQDNEAERLCIVDEAEAHELFLECSLSQEILEAWSVNWQGSALGNFARALLNALEIKGEPDGNAVRRIRTTIQAFKVQADELIRQMCQVNVSGTVSAREFVDDETGKPLARFTIAFEGGTSACIPLDADAMDRLTAKGLPVFELDSFELNEDTKIPMSMAQAINLGILDTSTVENIEAFPNVYPDPNWTFWHRLQRFFEYYNRDADAPMIWYNKVLKFWVPPVLHARVKRLALMSSTFTERDLREAFLKEEVEAIRLKPTVWDTGNKVFQTRTGIYEPETLLENYDNWNTIGTSKTGQRLFSSIRAEIERDLSVKHAIITHRPITRQLANVEEKENVCFVAEFKELEGLETAFEEAQVVWIVGTPAWEPGIIWRRAQILFGNDEKPLSYETETEPRRYKDERVQSVYEQHVAGLLTDIVGQTGLNRLSGKTVVLVTSFPLPDITDRPKALLFDWQDFEVAGGLDKLPEVIATRKHFETEHANLTADTSRTDVERILGCSSRQANRMLNKLRGGNIPRVLFREQIFSLLANGEKKTSELVDAIDGHPTSVRNELKRLVDAGEVVKVRWGFYSLPTISSSKQ